MQRRIPVDVSAVQFELTEEPRPVTDFETKARQVNDNGEAMFSVRLLARSAAEMAIISVKVAGILPGLSMGDPVTVTGLVATPWVNGNKAALAFTADRVASAAKAVSKVA